MFDHCRQDFVECSMLSMPTDKAVSKLTIIEIYLKETLKNCILPFFSTQRQKRGFAFACKIRHLRV